MAFYRKPYQSLIGDFLNFLNFSIACFGFYFAINFAIYFAIIVFFLNVPN